MSIQDIILQFILSDTIPREIPSYQLEVALPSFSKLNYGIIHTPASFARIFRMMRQDNVFAKNNLLIQEVKSKGARTKTWRVENILKLPSVLPSGTVSLNSQNSQKP